MRFLILGPLEVWADGRPLPVGGPRQRALLAVLLLNANRVVARERLLEELSGDEASATASHALTNQVSRLRKALGESRLLTRAPGYLLRVEPGELDGDLFQALLDSGRSAGDPRLARERLREAETLWRGPALADVELDGTARLEIARLEELRLCAVEARVDADLALGRHDVLVPELDAFTRAHPLRETPRRQHMLALYRAGRQEGALAVYRDTRARLVDELGLEPGPQLRELECAILRQDPALELAAAPRAAPGSPPHRPAKRRWLILVGGLGMLAAAALLATVPGGTAGPGPAIAPGVVLLDPEDGRVAAHIDSLHQPAEVVFGDRRFWVLNLKPMSFVAIDPRSGRIARRLASPVEDVGYYAVTRDRLWVSDSFGPTVIEVDSRTGRVVRRVRVSANAHDADTTHVVAVAYGSLWVSRPRSGLIVRVDRASGRIVHRFQGFTGIVGGAAAGGAVWVSSEAGLSRIDAASNTVTATAKLPQPLYFPAVGGGFAWAANEAKGETYKVDQHGTVVATYATGDGARKVDFSDGAAWVTNQDEGTVTRIDPLTGTQRSFATHHTISSAAAGGGRLLVEVGHDRSFVEELAALKGDVVRLVVPIYAFEPPDPALARNPFALQAHQATLAGLLNYPDAAAPTGLRLQPEIATEMPALSSDRRTYTFTIRPGHRFSPPSGQPVTAESFRRGIEHALSPKLGRAPGARVLGDLLGAREYTTGRARHIRGLRVRGATLRMTLTRPSPDFLKRLSLPYFAPLPTDTPDVAGGIPELPPPSAGPYYAAARINGEYLLLKRNPYYQGPRPHALDAIVLREGIDAARAIERVTRGEWDGVALPDPLLAPAGPLARRTGAYAPAVLPETRFIAFNARHGPFASARIRRAAAHALSHSALASVLDLIPSSSLLPPGIATTRPVTLTPPPRSLPAHIAVMAVPPDCDPCRRAYPLARTALARVGITLRRRAASGTTLRRRPESFHLLLTSAHLEYPDPASFLAQMFTAAMPRAWVPDTTRAALRRLALLTGSVRDRAAEDLAVQLAQHDVPVAALGHTAIGQLFSARVSCRISPRFGVDLAALCLR